MTNKTIYKLITKFLEDGTNNDVITYRGHKIISQSNTPGWAVLMLEDKEQLSTKDLLFIDFLTNEVSILDKKYEQPIKEAVEDFTGTLWPKQQYAFA